jgi:hypothetical protein
MTASMTRWALASVLGTAAGCQAVDETTTAPTPTSSVEQHSDNFCNAKFDSYDEYVPGVTKLNLAGAHAGWVMAMDKKNGGYALGLVDLGLGKVTQAVHVKESNGPLALYYLQAGKLGRITVPGGGPGPGPGGTDPSLRLPPYMLFAELQADPIDEISTANVNSCQ